jgi:hypothetical protein
MREADTAANGAATAIGIPVRRPRPSAPAVSAPHRRLGPASSPQGALDEGAQHGARGGGQDEQQVWRPVVEQLPGHWPARPGRGRSAGERRTEASIQAAA